jgi:predicted nucleotidyltransferase
MNRTKQPSAHAADYCMRPACSQNRSACYYVTEMQQISNKNELLQLARMELAAIYEKYRAKGMLAIYLWGSITRNDFDLATSDVDVLGVVSDDFPLSLNETIRDELTARVPQYEWGFQIIYLSELNGATLRSRLASAMSPQSILPSFPQWIHVGGKQFVREDFTVQDATVPERMRLNMEEIRRRLSNIPTDSDERKIRDRKGVVKACLLLVYNRQLMRHQYFDLNYDELPNKADKAESPILESLLEVKRQKLYDEAGFSPYITQITEFVVRVERELVRNDR